MSITRKELITSKHVSEITKLELYNIGKLLLFISTHDMTEIIIFIKSNYPNR